MIEVHTVNQKKAKKVHRFLQYERKKMIDVHIVNQKKQRKYIDSYNTNEKKNDWCAHCKPKKQRIWDFGKDSLWWIYVYS